MKDDNKKIKCVMCGKEKRWYICKDCFEFLKTKYPACKDLVSAIRKHKRLQEEK